MIAYFDVNAIIHHFRKTKFIFLRRAISAILDINTEQTLNVFLMYQCYMPDTEHSVGVIA